MKKKPDEDKMSGQGGGRERKWLEDFKEERSGRFEKKDGDV